MTEQQHRATPEQWANAEKLGHLPGWPCLLELRDRIAVLDSALCTQDVFTRLALAEQRIKELEAEHEIEKECILDIYERLDRLKIQHESNWARIVKLEEAANHPAIPDSSPAPAIAWARQLPVHDLCHPNGCDICQRDWPCARLLAEQDAKAKSKAAANSKSTPNPRQIRSSAEGAPAGGLMRAVGKAICSIADCGDTPLNWAPEARAAILAVAEWLDRGESGFSPGAAEFLRKEAERG